jgi:putative membrane protein insertion efficiency factor
MRTGGYISRLTAWLLLGLVRGYQLLLSPFVGGCCRHIPSCSEYALTAIERFGPWRGTCLTLNRLARCQPWGTSGYDPVPDRETKPRGSLREF